MPCLVSENESSLPLAAFSVATITDTRWLVGGIAKATNGLWYEILLMTPTKQCPFLQRLFFLHDIQVRRGGRASLTRLASEQQWSLEIDRMCLLGFIYERMEAAHESDFLPDVLAKIRLGMVEGCPGSFCQVFCGCFHGPNF